MRRTGLKLTGLRYLRPYWMLHMKDADNWKIYTVIHQPAHMRTEMAYQAWLGGVDRPYIRPRCMARQPLWLERKRHQLRPHNLQGAESALERYVLQWEDKFRSFGGTLRPTAEDLHIGFDLVERPLDLSYALLLLNYCRNEHDIAFEAGTFRVFLEACLRVDRLDVAKEAAANAEKLFGRTASADEVRFVNGEQDWYGVDVAGRKLPSSATSSSPIDTTSPSPSVDDEEARLLRELESLESSSSSSTGKEAGTATQTSIEAEEARLLAELEELEREGNSKS